MAPPGGGSGPPPGGSYPPPPDEEDEEAEFDAEWNGCTMRTDNPHQSEHQPTKVNYEANTTCRAPATSITHMMTISKWSCALGICVWLPAATAPRTSPAGARKYTSQLDAPCVTQKWKGSTLHYVRGVGDEFLMFVTGQSSDVLCSIHD